MRQKAELIYNKFKNLFLVGEGESFMQVPRSESGDFTPQEFKLLWAQRFPGIGNILYIFLKIDCFIFTIYD